MHDERRPPQPPAAGAGARLAGRRGARGAGLAGGQTVRDVNPGSGRLTTPAGSGPPGPLVQGGAADAAAMEVFAAAPDHAGNVVIADVEHQRIRVAAARTGTFYGRAMTAGDIYAVAGTGHPGFSGEGGLATAAELHGPAGAAADGAGNLVIADTGDGRIREVAG